TKYRKYDPSGTFTQAAKSIQPITNFFSYSNSQSDNEQENDEGSDGEDGTECDHEGDDKSAIDSDTAYAYDYLQYIALHLFFIYWKQYKLSWVKASLRSAKESIIKGIQSTADKKMGKSLDRK
ncbi:8887_t:CDS:2, partial [Funneliformis geosporum]